MMRRGFTLVELLLGMVMLALLGIALTRTLTMSSASTARALERMVIARSITATATLLREELGFAGQDEVQLIGGGAMNFPRTVGSASLCATAGSTVLLPRSEWGGSRDPEAGRDEANLLTDPATATWSRLSIVATGVGTCPDGTRAILLQLGGSGTGALYGRISEPVRLRGYPSGGAGWWGLVPASGASSVQPFSGPFLFPIPDPALHGTTLELRFHPLGSGDTIVRLPLGGL